MSASRHTVELGDWLGAIADAHGLDHWSKIWDHVLNESLRELRRSPDLVLVGDEVQIPEADEERGVPVPTGHRATFVARQADVLRLEVRGLGPFIEAFGPVDFKLECGSQTLEGRIETEGQRLEISLEPAAKQATLTLMGTDKHEFFIGGLGPVDETKGAHARLVNLGYGREFQPGGDPGPEAPEAEADPAVEALLAFQSRNDLTPTGKLDEPTKAALEKQYEG